jgi:hypothetical protein
MMRTLGIGAVCATLLGGCQQTVSPVANVQEQMRDRREAEHEKDLQEKAFVDKQHSAAKGTKTCLIKQYTSAHRARQLWDRGKDNPYTYVYSSKMSNIHFRVERGGSVGLAVGESTYPGMKSFFLIDGARFSADGNHYADVTSALPALKRDVEVKYAWHDWPNRNEINNTDAFAGFAEAYTDCIKYLRGENA